MKNKFFVFILLLFIIFNFKGQVHWLINKDEIPKCNFLKEGKFVNKELDDKVTEGYYMIFKDGFVIEFVNNGEFFIKSKIKYISECEYISEVVELSIPNYNLGIGTKVKTKIINTAVSDNLIEIESVLNSKTSSFVLQKIIK